MKAFKGFLFYLFPLFVLVFQIISYREFVKGNWVLYGIGFALLIFSHYKHCRLARDESRSIDTRRFYFTYFIFLTILLCPEIDRFNVLQKNTGMLGLSSSASMYLIVFLAALVIYFIVISDMSISEITIGNTKVTMLKEKYKADISNHMDLTSTLLDKISAENQIIRNLTKYCMGVRERLNSPDDVFIVSREYQLILAEYFKAQKNDDIRAVVLDNMGSFKGDYCLKSGELEELAYHMQNNEIHAFEKKGVYYLFIPYTYRFEDFKQKIYIVLESGKPIVIQAETKIVSNILNLFTDELLNLSTIEINGE